MTQDAPQLRDNRSRATGWPRLGMVILVGLAGVLIWRSIIASTTAFLDDRPLTGVLTLVPPLLWTAGTAGVLHNGRRMRKIAWGAWVLSLVGMLVGAIAQPDSFVHVNPWFHGGSTYYFLTTVGALWATGWLWWSEPSRQSARNGG